MNLENLRARRDEILEIAKRYHAANVRVFGSVLHGEARADSDTDFLVTFQQGASLLDQVGLMDDLKNVLGTKVDIVSDRALNRYLKARILQEARPL